MKIVNIILRILLGLLLIMPILGGLGLFPEPTADMYPTVESWEFIEAMMNTGYLMYAISLTFLVAFVLLVLNKTALMALVLAPITINIVLFHVFLDASPVSAYSAMGWVLLLLNAYFFWVNKEKYKKLW